MPMLPLYPVISQYRNADVAVISGFDAAKDVVIVEPAATESNNRKQIVFLNIFFMFKLSRPFQKIYPPEYFLLQCDFLLPLPLFR